VELSVKNEVSDNDDVIIVVAVKMTVAVKMICNKIVTDQY